MKHTKTQYGITFLVVMLGCLFSTGQQAQAGTKWVEKIVSVSYTYYEYETQTRYRLVQKAFIVTEYRYERRDVTTYRYEQQRVAVEMPSHRHGISLIKYVWKDVKVPYTTSEMVRVPYEKTVYKTVSEPYHVRVRVEKTGYRSEVQWVKVQVPYRKFPRSYKHNTYGSINLETLRRGLTLQIGAGRKNQGDRKYESIRDRDQYKAPRDHPQTVEYKTNPKNRIESRVSEKTRKTEKNKKTRKNRG